MTQTGSSATAVVVGIVPASGPMIVTAIEGTPTATGAWTGQSSAAVFNPTAVPATVTWSCETPDSAIPWPATSGWLSNDLISSGPSGPCCLTTGTGYTGQENQFYRVEIHTPGAAQGAGATFKWSRENASVQTTVTAIGTGTNTQHNTTTVLTVQSLGRDQVLGFQSGDWIEITGQTLDDNCQPGELAKIDFVTPSSMTITLTAPLTSTPPSTDRYTRIIRWDQKGKIYDSNNNLYIDLDAIGSGGVPNGVSGIPIPPAGTKVQLENGIVVSFGLTLANGNFLPMNYWNFAARTADGKIDVLERGARARHLPPLHQARHRHLRRIRRRHQLPHHHHLQRHRLRLLLHLHGRQRAAHTAPSSRRSMPSRKTGGEICLLAGDFYENVTISKKRNVVIHGCGAQTHVYSASLNPSNPAAAGGSGGSARTSPPSSPSKTARTSSSASSSSLPTKRTSASSWTANPTPTVPSTTYPTSNKDIRLEGLDCNRIRHAGHRRAQRPHAPHRAEHRHHAQRRDHLPRGLSQRKRALLRPQHRHRLNQRRA